MKKFLTPILDKDQYHKGVQKEIEYHLYTLIYKGIIDFLRENLSINIQNSKTSSLKEALKRNKIIYTDGYFIGKFNSSISKELRGIGAIWGVRKKGYKIGLSFIPVDVREAIAIGATKLASYNSEISHILSQTESNIAQLTFAFNFDAQIEHVFKNLNMQFVKTMAESITVTPEMSQSLKKALTEKFNTNMNLHIKGWREEAIVRLRVKVEKNALDGFRADTLERIIVNEFHTTKKKAKFLAMQETSLFVSKFREERYKESGVNRYRWSSSGDERVRDTHKHLHGKIFSFDNPPITNKQGDRNNPGEDYGPCRCVPIPIID